MHSAPILIFDSGVGGLTIHDSIKARLPGADFVYACDNAAFPYGPKPEDELVERVHVVLDALIARYRPRLLVVACNTASTVALPRLRQHYRLPIVGVVPAIKPAAQCTASGVIGLLATPGTVRRPYTDQLIRDFAAGCEVIRVGSSELVEIAEAKLRGQSVPHARLAEILKPLRTAPRQPDTIVLGCTHFPLLRDELAQALTFPVRWVDSGDAIAARVLSLLDGERSEGAGTGAAVFTRADANQQALVPALHRRGLTHIDILDLSRP